MTIAAMAVAIYPLLPGWIAVITMMVLPVAVAAVLTIVVAAAVMTLAMSLVADCPASRVSICDLLVGYHQLTIND